MRMPTAFAKACELAMAHGHSGINKLDGCCEIQVDEQWWLAINAHPEPAKSSNGDVPPLTVYFMFNGWPAAMVGPRGGTSCAGSVANEDTMIAALDAAIQAVSQ